MHLPPEPPQHCGQPFPEAVIVEVAASRGWRPSPERLRAVVGAALPIRARTIPSIGSPPMLAWGTSVERRGPVLWLLLLGLLLLPNETRAQTTPPPQVPVDVTAVTLPTVPSGQCLGLDPGELTVTVQLVGDGFGAPVRFTFAGYGGEDTGATL